MAVWGRLGVLAKDDLVWQRLDVAIVLGSVAGWDQVICHSGAPRLAEPYRGRVMYSALYCCNYTLCAGYTYRLLGLY